jgi:hypothetical protein
MIEIDINHPESLIYVQLDHGEYCSELNSLMPFARYDNYDLKGWVCNAAQLEQVISAVRLWLLWRHREKNQITFIEA